MKRNFQNNIDEFRADNGQQQQFDEFNDMVIYKQQIGNFLQQN